MIKNENEKARTLFKNKAMFVKFFKILKMSLSNTQ